jgi:hypothetical protein
MPPPHLRQAIALPAEKYDQPPDSVRFIEGLAHVDGHSAPLGEVVGLMRSEGRDPRAFVRILGRKPDHRAGR